MDFARGTKAPSFSLKSTDDTILKLSDLAGKHGTVVVFICNHCPYVISALDDLIHEAKTLQVEGIKMIAICSNDPLKNQMTALTKYNNLQQSMDLISRICMMKIKPSPAPTTLNVPQIFLDLIQTWNWNIGDG